MPIAAYHQELLTAFRKDYWALYRRLVAYRQAPSAEERERLQADFLTLVARRTGYQALDERIAKTAYNRELLLLVLDHPEIPLHNNDMELAARRRVRKRDGSPGIAVVDILVIRHQEEQKSSSAFWSRST
jgi:hypothetical protein